MATCPRCHVQYPDDVTACPADGEALLPDDAIEPDLPAGMKVGEYQVEGKLGEGGFGAVYRATHPIIGKTAAIKVLNRQFSATPEMVSRFVAEARAVNQIRHRNIIDIFSFGQLPDGRHYYVMELLVGQTLDRYVAERGRLAPEEAAPILRGIARALGAAHAAGIAHRDLKPENVFVAETEDGAHAKLIDFGIAKLLGDGGIAAHKTRTGAPIGTPHYMSPEQCRGKNVDHRTDIYALGVLVHVVLTGKLPFDGEDVMEVLMKQIGGAPPRLSEVCPDLPASLDAPVLAMLEKDPEKRPATVNAAFAALEAALGESPRPTRPSVPAAERIAIRPVGSGAEDARALADARTMVPTGDTVPPAKPEAAGTLEPAAIAAPARARPTRWALAGVAFAALAIAVFLGRARSPEGPAAAASAGHGDRAAAVASALQAPPKVEPAHAAEVELRVTSTPEIVDVLQGDKWLGTNRDPIRLARAESVRLTFKAEGYEPAERTIPASQSQAITITLSKRAPSPAPKGAPAPSAAAPKPKGSAAPAPRPPPRSGGNPSEVEF